jgi:hypothetical protein
MKNILFRKSMIIAIIILFFGIISLPASSNLQINSIISLKEKSNNIIDEISKNSIDELPSLVKFEINFYGKTHIYRINPGGYNFTIGFFCFSSYSGITPVANLTYWKLSGSETHIYIPNVLIVWGVLGFTDTNLTMPMDIDGGFLKGWSTTFRYIYF